MTKPTVAILGASTDRTKYGNKSVRAHQAQGFEVFPVNPKGEPIEGLITYKSLEDIPVKQLDRISVYLPPALGMKMLDEIRAAHAKEVWFNPGSESMELIEQAEAKGIDPIIACSIVDVGRTPGEFGG